MRGEGAPDRPPAGSSSRVPSARIAESSTRCGPRRGPPMRTRQPISTRGVRMIIDRTRRPCDARRAARRSVRRGRTRRPTCGLLVPRPGPISSPARGSRRSRVASAAAHLAVDPSVILRMTSSAASRAAADRLVRRRARPRARWRAPPRVVLSMGVPTPDRVGRFRAAAAPRASMGDTVNVCMAHASKHSSTKADLRRTSSDQLSQSFCAAE